MLARVVAVVVGMTLALALVGCGPKTQDPARLVGPVWVDRGAVGPEKPNVQFGDDGAISGFTGINNFGGTYKAQPDGSIVIELGAMALRAGTPQEMRREQQFLVALGAAHAYRVTDDALDLIAGNDMVLRLSEEEPVALEGTDWICTGYNNGAGAFSSVVASSAITARFVSLQLSGNAGVNSYSAGYEVTPEGVLTIGPVSATEMASEDESLMEQENAYLSALPKVERYEIVSSELTLYGAEDLRLATYRAMP